MRNTMINYFYLAGFALMLFAATGCGNSANNNAPADNDSAQDTVSKPVASEMQQENELSTFLPDGFVLFDTTFGDLDKDGSIDCVLIIKGTDSSAVVYDEYRGRMDRNRRGIIVLLNTANGYEEAVSNYDCFSSENEDGGVYYPPDLVVEIEKGNLYINYLHGRYGYWKYTFRLKDSDFELIGYDASSCRGPVVNKETSINFLTKKKQEKVNVNEEAESGEEVFEEHWSDVTISRLVRLSEVKDFDNLDTSVW